MNWCLCVGLREERLENVREMMEKLNMWLKTKIIIKDDAHLFHM